MAATPKTKPTSAPTRAARADRTSAVVTATLILLTALGIVTVFWEPLTALAVGAPAAESMAETRTPVGDAGAPATTLGAHDASGSS
jgi:hypothetical protein